MPDTVLIPEIDEAIRNGSTGRRAAIAEQVTGLFIGVAGRLDDNQVHLFDEILSRLIEEIEYTALAAISQRIAPVANAPAGVIRRLAGDRDIAVAGPVLRGSPRLADTELADLATRMGMSHLMAISQRSSIAAPITDILVERGDGGVLRVVAANSGARFSDPGLGTLVKRAAGDDRLAETIGLRPDLPRAHLRRLVSEATEIVRRRLLAAVAPEARHEIERSLAAAAAQAAERVAASFSDAQRTVLALVRAGKLDETALHDFAARGQRREVIASLSAMSRVPIDVVEGLMKRERRDAVLVLGGALGIAWPTMQAIMVMAIGPSTDPATTQARFEGMSRSSAERIVQFWRSGAGGTVRPG